MTIAVRRHFKYIVKDEYGNVISNATVNIYLPGTTTVFTGTAYTTLSGGTTTTNPFTSNSQGEVEAWFDTPQAVDLAITDNSDTAVRAGYTTPISFSPFTEYGLIGTGIEGTAANISGTSRIGQSAGAGSSAFGASADHQHATNGNAAQGRASKLTSTSNTSEQLMNTTAYSVGANTCAVGTAFRVRADFHQTNGTTATLYTFRLRWGGIAGTTLKTLTLQGTTTSHTDNPVHLDFMVNIQTIGGSGTAVTTVRGDECITTATANTPKLVLDAQAAAVTIDTTAAKDLSLTAQMDTTTGTPNWELDNIIVERIA